MLPLKKQDLHVIDNQRNSPVLFVESLPPPGGVGVLTPGLSHSDEQHREQSADQPRTPINRE
jgi:hypothetical protein